MATLRERQKDTFLQANAVPYHTQHNAGQDYISVSPELLWSLAECPCAVNNLKYCAWWFWPHALLSTSPSWSPWLCITRHQLWALRADSFSFSYTKCIWICFKGVIAVVMPRIDREIRWITGRPRESNASVKISLFCWLSHSVFGLSFCHRAPETLGISWGLGVSFIIHNKPFLTT